MKIIQNGSGILVMNSVTPMIIVDHNRHQIINLNLIRNINSIIIIELNSAMVGGETQTYRIEFPTKGGTRECPVEVCPGRAGTRTAMRVNFCSRHVWDIVIILEEGNLPHPR